MLKKILLPFLALIIIVNTNPPTTKAAETGSCSQYAGVTKIWWNGMELKKGQIGRLTVLKDTPLYKVSGETKTFSRTLKKGEFYRIYAFKPGMLSVGGGYYVTRDSKVSYETPSKAKLQAVQCINQPIIFPDGWVAPVLKSAWSPNPAVNYATLQNELGFTNGGASYSIPSYPKAINVIHDNNEVTLQFYFWRTNSIEDAYRIPIVATELFKLYFGDDATRVWNYFNNDEIPEQFTANGRNVTATYSASTGAISLHVSQ